MKNIVVVDDYLEYLENVKEFIEFEGKFKCDVFSDPEEALNYLSETNDVDCVVIDYIMPKMNGLVLAKEVRNNFPKIEIIVMSGHHTEYLKNIFLNEGLDVNKFKFLCKSNVTMLKMLLDG